VILCILIALGAWSVTAAIPHDTITVTAHAGAKQTFQGFGCNHVEGEHSFEQLPAEIREELCLIEYRDLDFRFIRTWMFKGATWSQNAHAWYVRYGAFLDEVWKANPDVKLQLCPTGEIGDPAEYAGYYVREIDTLKQVYGIEFAALSISNEPNNPHVEMSPEMAPLIIRHMRDSLDARGLQSVGIIAPETSNIGELDWISTEILDAILDDPKAMASLYGFAIHSYLMGMTKDWYDRMEPHMAPNGPLVLWQTESCHGLQSENFTDSPKGAETAARVLSDFSFGVTVWMYWKGVNPYVEEDNGSNLIGYDHIMGEYKVFFKFYYLRQIGRTFDVGCVFRRVTTSLSEGRFKYMENTYCNPDEPEQKRPPVVMAAAQNPNGEWGIAVVNQTGIPPRNGARFIDSTVYDVSVVVEDLDGTGDVEYLLMRTNLENPNQVDREPVTVSDGKIQLAISPIELISLRPSFNTDFIEPRGFPKTAPECGGCGSGVVAAFIPPIGFKLYAISRRRRRRHARHAARSPA
jgi:O-glycosyl hydrolase